MSGPSRSAACCCSKYADTTQTIQASAGRASLDSVSSTKLFRYLCIPGGWAPDAERLILLQACRLLLESPASLLNYLRHYAKLSCSWLISSSKCRRDSFHRTMHTFVSVSWPKTIPSNGYSVPPLAVQFLSNSFLDRNQAAVDCASGNVASNHGL